jgi:Na+-transporting methylmalonyl-CoA/oxaloacetate decarboxylase gamma subunit
MQRKITSAIIIIVMLGLIGSIPFLEQIIPAQLINEFGITGIFGLIGIILIVLIIALIFVNKVGKVTKKAITTHKENKQVKKEKRIRVRPLRENKVVVPVLVDDKKIDEDKLKEKRDELALGLKEAEKQFLKNKIDKQTFADISKTKNSELIKIESSIDSQRKINLTGDEIKELNSVSKDKKKILQDLLEQKQKKVYELQVTEKSFYKRKIDEITFKKISSEIKSEIISIEGKIKAIQKSSAVQKMKEELKKGALEVAKQKEKTQKRKSEEEIFEEEMFEQIDDLVGGLKR